MPPCRSALFGTRDAAVHRSLAAPETANADDYTLETVNTTHFIIDERPDLVRTKLIARVVADSWGVWARA